ncbi:hypothetical protein I7I53_03658 [Histoplasma capsulatum var. duboisii H88]|uniref:Uncharacterized protein n=1 Tax=Ajellomyces capsulatus (strain H88) TaxID=544711 RepID=A0A8A1LUS5_AJEC8|nr:hypothetical protein I7I53_03658 [Histoplasma capsulatum var. duboisii H88]
MLVVEGTNQSKPPTIYAWMDGWMYMHVYMWLGCGDSGLRVYFVLERTGWAFRKIGRWSLLEGGRSVLRPGDILLFMYSLACVEGGDRVIHDESWGPYALVIDGNLECCGSGTERSMCYATCRSI